MSLAAFEDDVRQRLRHISTDDAVPLRVEGDDLVRDGGAAGFAQQGFHA